MAQDNRPRVKSTETVTVACKLPNGLILQLFDMADMDVPVMGGGVKTVKQAKPIPGATVQINGSAHAQNAAPNCVIAGGYALTPGVDKSFWDRWLEANKDSMMVQNNLIFAQPTMEDAQSEATEKATVKSNLERLDPKSLPRGVQHADEMAKETRQKVEAAA